jgi:ATP dependent DNA ligase domain
LKPHPSWEKVDGWRMLAYKTSERVRLVSRNGRDHTRRFADLTAAVAKLSARTLVLDGEVAIYDQPLRCQREGDRDDAPLSRPAGAPRYRRRASSRSRSCASS